jgi:hypothetical protein
MINKKGWTLKSKRPPFNNYESGLLLILKGSEFK